MPENAIFVHKWPTRPMRWRSAFDLHQFAGKWHRLFFHTIQSGAEG
jgi:hypothetical protein